MSRALSPSLYLPLALAFALFACDSSSGPATQPKAGQVALPRDGDAVAANSAGEATNTDQSDQSDQLNRSNQTASQPADASLPPPRGNYELLGVIDPGINNEVAFAMKIPRGWHAKQSFTRKWNGSTPYNQVYIALRSPDGADQIEYLPSTAYFYSDGPQARQMRQLTQQYGATQPTPGELPPMPPLTYIKQVLLPKLNQNGLQLRPTGEYEAPPKHTGPSTTSSGYVEGTLANGKRARVSCLLSLNTTNLNGEAYYTWETLPSIAQSSHDVAKIHEYLTTGQASVTVNPAWAQQNQGLVTKGNTINRDLNQRNYEIQRDAQRHQQETFAAVQRDRSASQDRRAEAFGDMIRGEAKYADPTTGERVQVQDGYNHVYRDRQDPTTTYSTNTPIDAGQVNWQELQRVALKDY